MAHVPQTPLSEAALMARPTAEIGRLQGVAALLALVGIGGSIGGYFMVGEAFWQSYLIGFIFWVGITLGSMAVLMVQHLSGGGWGLAARRVLEASTRNIWFIAALFLPIVFKMQTLYIWSIPDVAAHDEAIQAKAAYLNPKFFIFRAILFFFIWGTLIYFLNKWSRQQDEEPAVPPGPKDRRFRLLSAPGLVLYVITVTFMSVDWIMSLDPHWYSTIFGILTLGGQGLSTFAFTILILAILSRTAPISQVVSADNFHDLGKLMFAFLLLWAYFSVSQLIIIWSANLPEEIPFYLKRLTGPWYPVSVTILIGQFVIPFFLLLSRGFKRKPRTIGRIAVLILVMRLVDLTWTMGPVFRHEGSTLSWVDFAVTLGIGGVWLWLFFRNLGGRALVPVRDPYFKEAMAHGGH